MTKCHGLRTKTPLDILRARIAEAYVALGAKERVTVEIPLWVAEELKQALEKQ